ncbi:MAG: hypothetical protein OHK0056_25230 [Bacteriovoracaceae bacterium]
MKSLLLLFLIFLSLTIQVEKDPCLKNVPSNLIDYCISKASLIKNIEGGNTKETIEYWKNVRNEICDDISSCNRAGWIEYNLKNYEKALSYYKRSIKYYLDLKSKKMTNFNHGSYFALVQNNAALSLKRIGKFEEALSMFKTSCNLNNRYGCLNVAIIYAEINEDTKSFDFFHKSLSLDYDDFIWLKKSKEAEPLRRLDGFLDLID